MNRSTSGRIALTSIALVLLFNFARHTRAQDAKTNYPTTMPPLEQYLMDRDAEVALARSAAPDSISRDAQVMVLGPHGYETAVPGKNGFVCVVERSWTVGMDNPEFWNSKLRGPICFNPPAARSYLPLTIKKTELVLAGTSREQMYAAITAAIDKKEFPALETHAMCYMLSKQGYLNDHDGHWHPHVMIFVPGPDVAAWGADLDGSPVIAAKVPEDRLTILLIPVRRWSDGTADPVKD